MEQRNRKQREAECPEHKVKQWWSGTSDQPKSVLKSDNMEVLESTPNFFCKGKAYDNRLNTMSSESSFDIDYGRAISIIPEGLPNYFSDESCSETKPVIIDISLKEGNGVSIKHYERLKEFHKKSQNLSDESSFGSNIKRNAEYFERLRKYYDLEEHVPIFSALYLDRARSEDALKKEDCNFKLRSKDDIVRDTLMRVRSHDGTKQVRRLSECWRGEQSTSLNNKRACFQRSVSDVTFANCSSYGRDSNPMLQARSSQEKGVVKCTNEIESDATNAKIFPRGRMCRLPKLCSSNFLLCLHQDTYEMTLEENLNKTMEKLDMNMPE